MAWQYSTLLFLLSFTSVAWGAPLDFNNEVHASTLSPFWVSFLSGLGTAAVLILLILVIFGCLCCQNHGFKTFSEHNGIQLPQHRNISGGGGNYESSHADSEFTIFPPAGAKLSYGLGNGDSDPVTFEPLPEIHPRNVAPFERLISSNHPPKPASFKSSVARGLSLHDWFNPLHGGNFPRSRLQYLQEVGVGWYGQAVEGEAQQILPDQRKTRVVVKILREDASPSEHMYFLHEVRLFRDLRHPNILRLLGQCLETDPFLVLLEHCQTDLKSYLISQRSSSEELVQGGGLLEMAYQLTLGLQHMHSKGFIHSDLAARNCLLDHQRLVKIGDFGTSYTLFPEDYYCLGEMAIPLRWSAPETLHPTDKSIESKEINQEANLWSFGVLLWELMELGKQPYMELSDDLVLAQVITQQQTKLEEPKTPCLHRALLYQVMQECWGPPESRPNIGKVQTLLSHLQQNKEMPPSLAFEERWRTLQQQPPRQHNLLFTLAPPETPPLVFESHFNPKSASLQNLRGSLEDIAQRQEQEKEEEKVQQEISLAIQELDDYLASEITSSEISSGGSPEQKEEDEQQRGKDSAEESDGDSAILCNSLAPADAHSDMDRETEDFTSLEDSPKSTDLGCRLPEYVSSCAAVSSPPSPPPSPSMRCGNFGCSPTNYDANPVGTFGPAHPLTLLDTPPVTPDTLCSVSTTPYNSRCLPLPGTDSYSNDSLHRDSTAGAQNFASDWDVVSFKQPSLDSVDILPTKDFLHSWDFGLNSPIKPLDQDLKQQKCDVSLGMDLEADDKISVESSFSFLQNESVGDINELVDNLTLKKDNVSSCEEPVSGLNQYDYQIRNDLEQVFQKSFHDFSVISQQDEIAKSDGSILETFSNIHDSLINMEDAHFTKDKEKQLPYVYKTNVESNLLRKSDLHLDLKIISSAGSELKSSDNLLILNSTKIPTPSAILNYPHLTSVNDNISVHLDFPWTLSTKALTLLNTMATEFIDNLLASCFKEVYSSKCCSSLLNINTDPIGNTVQIADTTNDASCLSSSQKDSACSKLLESTVFSEIILSNSQYFALENVQDLPQCVNSYESSVNNALCNPNLEQNSQLVDHSNGNHSNLSTTAQLSLDCNSEKSLLSEKDVNSESLHHKTVHPITSVLSNSREEPEYSNEHHYEIDDILAGLEHDEIVLDKDFSPLSDESGRKSAEDCTLFLEDLETGNREPIRCCASPQELLDDELLIVDVETNEAMMLNPALRTIQDHTLYNDFLHVESYPISRLESILEESDEISLTNNDDNTQASSIEPFQPSPGNVIHSIPPELVFEGDEYLAGDGDYNDTDDDDDSSFHSEEDDDLDEEEDDVEASEEFHFQVVSPFAFGDSRPEDAYTPDFESETDDTSSSTGTSRSSSSGSFECPKDSPQSPVRVFSTTWDSTMTPTKSAIKSPEKNKYQDTEEEAVAGNGSGDMKKSVSFHEDNPMIVFSYPPAESDEESEGHEEIATDEFAWHTDYKNYADWEFQWLEEEIPEEEVEEATEEDSSDGRLPTYPVAKKGNFQAADMSTMMYSLCCQDMLDSLESQNSLPSLSESQDMVLSSLPACRQLYFEVSNDSNTLSHPISRPEMLERFSGDFLPLRSSEKVASSGNDIDLKLGSPKFGTLNALRKSPDLEVLCEPFCQETFNKYALKEEENGKTRENNSKEVLANVFAPTDSVSELPLEHPNVNHTREDNLGDATSNLKRQSQFSPKCRAILQADHKPGIEFKVETINAKDYVTTSQLGQTSPANSTQTSITSNSLIGNALPFQIQPINNMRVELSSTILFNNVQSEDSDLSFSNYLFTSEEPFSLNISPDEDLQPDVTFKASPILTNIPSNKDLATNIWVPPSVASTITESNTPLETKLVELSTGPAVEQQPKTSPRTEPKPVSLSYPEDVMEAVNPMLLVAGDPRAT